MEQLASDLKALVKSAAAQLGQVADGDASVKSAPGEWSYKEIIGHLIDSAGNNHQRFVRAQRDEPHDFPGYDQDAWVALQGYQERDWALLVTLWEAYNLHLADVIAGIAEERLETACTIKGQPWTVREIAVDYVGHMQWHLNDLPVEVSDIKRYAYPKYPV